MKSWRSRGTAGLVGGTALVVVSLTAGSAAGRVTRFAALTG